MYHLKITLKRKATSNRRLSGCPPQVKKKPPIDKTEWDGFFDENGQLAKSRDFICVNILERVWSPSLGLPLELGSMGGQRGRWHWEGLFWQAFREPMASHSPSRPQGLHPFVRTEAWKFLTGYYSWQSSQDERLTVDSTRR